MPNYHHFIGIDVAADTLCVAGSTISPFTVRQNPSGWQQCITQLQQYHMVPNQTLIVMEATGPYTLEPAEAFHQAGFHVSIINPLKSHYFAKTLLKTSKTDLSDAALLALFGQHFEPRAWQPPPAIHHDIHQCLLQREMSLHVRQQLGNQYRSLQQSGRLTERYQARYEQAQMLFKQQINALERELRILYGSPSIYQANASLLLSICGVGIVTTGWLLILTQNFAFTESAQELASFCGLVPHARISGKALNSKRRVAFAGAGRLRRTLYMATLSAGQRNPPIRDFYQHLLEQGKPQKVARIAAARKLSAIVYGVVRHQQPFDPNYSSVSLPKAA